MVTSERFPYSLIILYRICENNFLFVFPCSHTFRAVILMHTRQPTFVFWSTVENSSRTPTMYVSMNIYFAALDRIHNHVQCGPRVEPGLEYFLVTWAMSMTLWISLKKAIIMLPPGSWYYVQEDFLQVIYLPILHVTARFCFSASDAHQDGNDGAVRMFCINVSLYWQSNNWWHLGMRGDQESVRFLFSFQCEFGVSIFIFSRILILIFSIRCKGVEGQEHT